MAVMHTTMIRSARDGHRDAGAGALGLSECGEFSPLFDFGSGAAKVIQKSQSGENSPHSKYDDSMPRFIYFFGDGRADAGGDLKHLVGGKGASLADMTRAGLNVPPGFTISAECCQLYFQNQRQWPTGLEDQVRAGLARLEALSGRAFGRGDAPVLLAVRSGPAV